MKLLLKLFGSILLFIVAAICAYGFLATFEGDTSIFLFFRAVYGIVGVMALVGGTGLLSSIYRTARSSRTSSPQE